MPFDTPTRVGAITLCVVAALTGPGQAQAAAPGYDIQLGVIESDNLERLPAGGTSETIAVEEVGLDWHDKRPWFDADIDADMSHLDYFPHAYTDQFIGNFIGTVKVNLAPDYLSWNFADNFGQIPLQPLAPITPANQEYFNYLTTGPTLSLPLAQATWLDVTGQYGRMTYQQSTLDGTTLTGGVGLRHEVSANSSLSVDVREEGIRFDNNQLNFNYDRQEAFARFDTKGSRTTLEIDLGDARLSVPGANDNTPLARLDVSRRLSASSTIGLAAGHDYSDGADSFRLVQGVGGATLNIQPILAANAPFVSNYGTLAWNFQHSRTTLTFSGSYYRDRYQTDAGLDNDRTMVAATASRQFTPTVNLALTEYLTRWHFDAEGRSDTTTDTALQLSWRLGSRFSVIAAYYLAKGSGNVPGFQYTENRVWLALRYGRAAEAPPGPAAPRLPGMQ
jgi:hypothetical protein